MLGKKADVTTSVGTLALDAADWGAVSAARRDEGPAVWV